MEELVSTVTDEEESWHRVPRWKRVPPLDAGTLLPQAARPGRRAG